MKPTLLFISLLVAAARPLFLVVAFNHHIESSYQAGAHLLVGGLFGAWLVNRERWLLATVVGLSAVEVVCAAIGVLS